ncbi:DUF202 domain-containing protein [Sinomonas sp. JGH33]|uniref:DUF202 domain-containing protein n=1 Tax=Sinomonas terricola TaxID=3110330 RepID=A0ABU5T8B8_9MICC|nr:DUF202 domain-containing protein [Sinomonas sp. JGH33]MEA5455927.1 DUF202 domain-containing protein [Sinomonas sp. JGH33]
MSVFDPGLQPERTGLAWQRTCLSFLGGSLVAMKVLPQVFGAWTICFGAAGAIEATILLVAVHRRYRTRHRLLTENRAEPAPIADGRLVGALALSTVAAGVVSLWLAIAIHFG